MKKQPACVATRSTRRRWYQLSREAPHVARRVCQTGEPATVEKRTEQESAPRWSCKGAAIVIRGLALIELEETGAACHGMHERSGMRSWSKS